MSSRLNIFCLVIATLLSMQIFADKVNPHYQEQTLRERCRQQMAGTYIEAYDRKNHSEDYTKLLEQKGKELKDAIAKADADVKKRKARESEAEYSIEEQRSIRTAEQNRDRLQTLLGENAGLLSTARQTREGASKIEADLRRQIEKVFFIEAVKSDPKGKFPFSMNYKEQCPRYKSDCPLSKAAAYDLLNIVKDNDNADHCKKYGALSGVSL